MAKLTNPKNSPAKSVVSKLPGCVSQFLTPVAE